MLEIDNCHNYNSDFDYVLEERELKMKTSMSISAHLKYKFTAYISVVMAAQNEFLYRRTLTSIVMTV